MNEQAFIQTINERSQALAINPLLLLSGIEGLYTFKDVQLNSINYEFLDSLILTIFALRIGDQFHTIAEENLLSNNSSIRSAANKELIELSRQDIIDSSNPYLQSFASILNGRSPIRRYHEKALEVAALEIKKTQLNFNINSISTIMLAICKEESNSLGLETLFQ
jgi:hypothetical protein